MPLTLISHRTVDYVWIPDPLTLGIGAPVPLGTQENQVRNLSHNQIEGHCTWGRNPSLSLGDVVGTGTCGKCRKLPGKSAQVFGLL